MASDSRVGGAEKATLEGLMRERIRATIEAIVEEELVAALGASRSARVGAVRIGYRHGKRARTLTTSLGATTIAMPRRASKLTMGGSTSGRAGLFRATSAGPNASTRRSLGCI